MSPDDGRAAAPEAPVAESGPTIRHDRPPFLAVVSDADSETILREGLADALPGTLDIRRGNIRTAIALLHKLATPETLIVDISGEERALNALGDLSDVVEPGVRVLVIGEFEDVNFYRHVTRGLGALEYLYKPLTRDMVARHFGPLIARKAPATQGVQGGRVVAVIGARGGVGASSVAVHLAWHFGVEARRHTVLLDADVHQGTAALMLGAKPSPGLRVALEAPSRVDSLFVERAAQPAADRLHVLGAEEKVHEPLAYSAGAAANLINALKSRYNFVIIDLPYSPLPWHREMFDLVNQRILVTEPSVHAMRDTLRLMALPNAPSQPRRAMIVLNRAGIPGGLKSAHVTEALKAKPDIEIPYIPRLVGHAANLGTPGHAAKGPFRTAILSIAREVAFLGKPQHGEESGGKKRKAARKRLFGIF